MTYRGENEVANYRKAKDPLALFRHRVTDAKLLNASDLDKIDHDVKARIKQAVIAAKAGALPSPADLLTDVYVSY